MTIYTVRTRTDTEDGQDTTTQQIAWDGTADDLAAHYRTTLAGVWGHWSVTVDDGTTTTVHTDDDESERVRARQAIAARWETQEREHSHRIEATTAGVDPDIRDAQIHGVAELLRSQAADELSDLGYQLVHDQGVTRIVDERSPDGMLSLITRAERHRRDCDHDAEIHMSARNDLIRRAHALKVAPADLARAARVSPARIHQIRTAST